jgi:hypothetical protein
VIRYALCCEAGHSFESWFNNSTIVKSADYVGEKFPEEARRMHYGEAEHRSIYGEASPDAAKSLADEGIEFHPLPRLPDERN